MHVHRRYLRELREGDTAREARITLDEIVDAGALAPDELEVHTAENLRPRCDRAAGCLQYRILKYAYRKTCTVRCTQQLLPRNGCAVTCSITNHIHGDDMALDHRLHEIVLEAAVLELCRVHDARKREAELILLVDAVEPAGTAAIDRLQNDRIADRLEIDLRCTLGRNRPNRLPNLLRALVEHPVHERLHLEFITQDTDALLR